VRTPLLRLLAATASLALAAALTAACGGGDSGTPAPAGSCQVQVSTNTKTKPTVVVPQCSPPGSLQRNDVVAGSGPAAVAGDSVRVQYVGIAWSNRRQFDASWDHGGQPFAVSPLGQAQVITGWNQGLIGVRAGTRRLLVIPPALGYGVQGSGEIKSNETLVFVVDVVSVN